MDNQIQIIKEVLDEFLNKATIEGQIDFVSDLNHPRFVIKTKNAGILIGEDGGHLLALNHLVKKISEKRLKKEGLEQIVFFLDVNDYQMKRIENIENEARMSAQRVMFFKKELELDPMSSYDRRIVHAILGEYPDIKTESVGEEPYRRVVIKPIVM